MSTPSSVDITIMTALGWTKEHREDRGFEESVEWWVWAKPGHTDRKYDRTGGFELSLDMCQEFELSLNNEDWATYRQHLFTITAGKTSADFVTHIKPYLPPGFSRSRAYAMPTAAQKCAAFLRTKKLA